jgi:hypothetical protein
MRCQLQAAAKGMLLPPLIVTVLLYFGELDTHPLKVPSLEPPLYLLLHAVFGCIRTMYNDIHTWDLGSSWNLTYKFDKG